jgi:hypothetical protein
MSITPCHCTRYLVPRCYRQQAGQGASPDQGLELTMAIATITYSLSCATPAAEIARFVRHSGCHPVAAYRHLFRCA